MSANENPYRKIKRNHRHHVPKYLARVALTGGTLRMFDKGSGDILREFLVAAIGCGDRLKRAGQREFEKEHRAAIRKFPSKVRLNANARRAKSNFAQKAKVIDLYLKALCFGREPLTEIVANRLKNSLHVPLDNIVLRQVWEHFGRNMRGFKKSPSLSTLTREQYFEIQRILARHAHEERVPPILYDDLFATRGEKG
jgi:hypothetical protein